MASDEASAVPQPPTREAMMADRGFLRFLVNRKDIVRESVRDSLSLFVESESYLVNATTLRRDALSASGGTSDPRRNLDDECGYPPRGQEDINRYQDLFNRSSIANRVVSFWPSETWQVEPEVFEDDDPNITTPFEQAVSQLLDGLNTEENFFEDEKGNTLWQYLYKLDKLSGVGHYGILLLGLDDGLPLYQPVAGITETGSLSVPKNKLPVEFPEGDVSKELLQNQQLPPIYTLTVNKVPAGPPGGKPPVPKAGAGTNGKAKTGELDDDKEMPKLAPMKRKLIYLRAYAETSAEVSEVETNRTSPRYGKPTKYYVQLHPEAETGPAEGVTGLIQTSQHVHWTRVIHVADNLLDNETYGVPRLEPALNDVLNLNKVYGAGGEGYYKGAFPGHSFETHPSMGADVNVDIGALRNMYEEYQNGLQRGMFTAGLTVKTLEPQVVDPSNHINRYLDAICVYLECPKRIFMGSERGELASGQDAMQHRGKIKQRQQRYVTPRMIVPLFNRLIWIGCLPTPETSYKINWPKVETLDMASEAAYAKTMAEAIAAYKNSDCEVYMPAQYFFTVLLGFRDEEVEVWLEEGKVLAEEKKQEEADRMRQEQDMAMEQTRLAASLKPPPASASGKPKGAKNGKPQTTAINPKPKK